MCGVSEKRFLNKFQLNSMSTRLIHLISVDHTQITLNIHWQVATKKRVLYKYLMITTVDIIVFWLLLLLLPFVQLNYGMFWCGKLYLYSIEIAFFAFINMQTPIFWGVFAQIHFNSIFSGGFVSLSHSPLLFFLYLSLSPRIRIIHWKSYERKIQTV